MLVECKKELVKSVFGAMLLLLGLLLAFFGRTEQFGYLDTHLLLVSGVVFALFVTGSILATAYLRCVTDINRKIVKK